MRKEKPATKLLAIAIAAALPLAAQVAPDATTPGPLGTTSAEYKFPAQVDPDISPLPTELWARVYRPSFLGTPPYPLLIFLHGNHATCGHFVPPDPARHDDNTQYTFYGTCPPNYVMAPSYMGYSYVADRLASWGYIVVSINANRGVNAAPGPSDDLGLNLTRGRLLLKHLQRLSEWNTFGGTPDSLGVELQGMLDFSSVGLFGHSRGGEGVRAAYNLYRDPDSPWPDRIPDAVNFEGVFELGPVDGQTSRILNSDGTAWNVLLPMCDGDVSDLQGIKPFDRVLSIFDESPATQKSTFVVWGANHNFFNTEWQQSDSPACSGPDNNPLFMQPVGSPQQQQVARAAVMAFFRGNVGPDADPTFNENFDPEFMLPPVVTSVTRVDRGYTDSPNDGVTTVFEDFVNVTGVSSYGFPNDANNITIIHAAAPPNENGFDAYGRQAVERAGVISWTMSGPETYFQTNWTPAGTGADISGYATLDLRLSRQCGPDPLNTSCTTPSPMNPDGPTNFAIRLAQADGTLSDPVMLNTYLDVRGPVGGPSYAGLHPILQTARIPLGDFPSVDLTQIRGVRLVFNDTSQGAIYVSNIRLSFLTGLGAGAGGNASAAAAAPGTSAAQPAVNTGNDVNVIKSIRTVASSSQLANQPAVEIELNSSREFTVHDELFVLLIGDQSYLVSRYADNGDTHTLIFTIPADSFAQTNSGAPVAVQYARGVTETQWDFGALDKSILNRP